MNYKDIFQSLTITMNCYGKRVTADVSVFPESTLVQTDTATVYVCGNLTVLYVWKLDYVMFARGTAEEFEAEMRRTKVIK